MSGRDQATRIVRFGVFEVDLRTAELRKQGVRIRLSGQSFQVLEALLLRPGELVTREELKQKLWPSDSFGDFEHGLNTAVNRVREALGDSSDNLRFVETLPRRGYRFIAPVDNGESEAKTTPELPPTPSQNEQAPADADVLPQPAPAPKARWISAVLALLLLISVGAWLFVRFKDRQSPVARQGAQQDLKVVPLTTLPGQELSPSFSPDGSQVVFAWDGGNSNATNPFNLYVKVIGSENIEQLTHGAAKWMVPAWSPDGSTIAFVRNGGQNPGIFSVPARGGAERRLVDAKKSCGMINPTLSWSTGGQQLVYATNGGIRVLTPETGEVRTLDTGQCEASAPAFSPDGKWIAFTCGLNGVYYLDLAPAKGGRSRHFSQEDLAPLAWTNDSQRVVADGLTEIKIDDGKGRPLLIAQNGSQAAIAPRGERLAYVTEKDRVNIWRADTKTGRSRSVLFPSTVQQRLPNISPDGKRIAFDSERSGSEEVWTANLNGSDAIQLSNFHSWTGTPKWSPNGRTIVFDSRTSGKPALYLVDPATALPRQISTNGMLATDPSWSNDGKWIYFSSASSDPTDHLVLYRVTSSGGIPERVSSGRGINAQQSRDGKFLYFASASYNTRIQVLDMATRRQSTLEKMPDVSCAADWVLSSKGIFFVDQGSGSGKPSIDFFDFSEHRVTKRIPLDKQPFVWGGLSLSSDETWLAYSQVDQIDSNLMLVEGFR